VHRTLRLCPRIHLLNHLRAGGYIECREVTIAEEVRLPDASSATATPGSNIRRTSYGNFRFAAQGVMGEYLYLFDYSRVENRDNNRRFHLRIPLKGGMVQWSFPNPFIWRDLHIVQPEK
jgi:hypothetical protein